MSYAVPNMFVAAPFPGMATPAVFPQVVSFVPVMVPTVASGNGMMHNACQMHNPPPTTGSVPSNNKKALDRRGQAAKKSKGHQPGRSEAPKRPSPPAGGNSQAEADDDGVGRGTISLLQEFVQCSRLFPSPQHRPILQWNFDTQMADFSNLKFRAQVIFLLDGVPHHVAGSWQQSKKLAQRDAAERCLGFFIGCWGAYLVEHGDEKIVMNASLANDTASILEEFCQSFPPCSDQPLNWSIDSDGSSCRAFVDVHLLGVRHTFAGSHRASVEEAKADTAKRVLWYLQCPGFEDAFEPDPDSSAMTDKELPAAPANWANSAEDSDAVHAAERKTALMKVQNRLQQTFGRQLKPGQSVCEWSYETDPDDAAWPPLCRSTAHVAGAGRSFEGPWVRGQREAQLETCQLITAFLDSGCLSPTGSVASTVACSGEDSDTGSDASKPKVRPAADSQHRETGPVEEETPSASME